MSINYFDREKSPKGFPYAKKVEENELQKHTTKASDTTKRMLEALRPSVVVTALTSNRKGGFWPDKSASELPAAY